MTSNEQLVVPSADSTTLSSANSPSRSTIHRHAVPSKAVNSRPDTVARTCAPDRDYASVRVWSDTIPRMSPVDSMISARFGGEEGIRTLDTALDRITV